MGLCKAEINMVKKDDRQTEKLREDEKNSQEWEELPKVDNVVKLSLWGKGYGIMLLCTVKSCHSYGLIKMLIGQ